MHSGGQGAKIVTAASPAFAMAASASHKSPERELLIEERRESPSRSLLLASALKQPFEDAESAGGNDDDDDDVDVEEEEEQEAEAEEEERKRQLDHGGSKRSLGAATSHPSLDSLSHACHPTFPPGAGIIPPPNPYELLPHACAFVG